MFKTKMECQNNISTFFSYIDENKITLAKGICASVKVELSTLKQTKDINSSDADIIKEIEDLTENILIGNFNIVKRKYKKVRAAFMELMQHIKSKKGHHTEDTVIQHKQRQDQQPGMLCVERREHQENEDINYRRMQENKRASLAMVQNNPDIADLSDTNRPTKIAERFSEMYDNEWTEVFEALSKLKKGTLEESEIISILLEIVQEAYKICQQEAQSQIREMESVFAEILTGQKGYQADHADEGRTLLIQYRKGRAGIALERLHKNFRGKLNDICKKRLSNEPSDAGPAVRYARKAVELTWWMCVQDPPVYMCPTTDNFDQNMYKAYTKSGSNPEFFVWPALRLHKDGVVLLKGVVQFK
ncbi:uncharacterized protein LOC123545122 [Mercenaria mercenaria]|uniref:uncharacterized protein LOC123545122 n=1 Tax=Mercenaria mercenaria TaxID=6596 RepID=UPI001E1DD1EC|nr:uncharacterized protein LOC123545122 [Mercenaria mercenaria]